MESGQLFGTLVCLALGAAACEPGPPNGLVTFDVAEDGTVAVYVTDAAGAIIAPDDVYLQVRGVRTALQYAGQGEVTTFCEQLPKSGPLELRLTAGFECCPEIHASAHWYAPPEDKRADGTVIPPVLAPLAQRCTDPDAVLMHTDFWLPANCENVRGAGAQCAEPSPTTDTSSTSG